MGIFHKGECSCEDEPIKKPKSLDTEIAKYFPIAELSEGHMSLKEAIKLIERKESFYHVRETHLSKMDGKNERGLYFNKWWHISPENVRVDCCFSTKGQAITELLKNIKNL